MAAVSAPTTPNIPGGLIDPTKQAEYPILLGERLARTESSKDTRYINVTYNHKPKGALPHQKSSITPGESPDLYKLTIQDKASNPEQTDLTYVYHGGVDPESSVPDSETSNLVLIFDTQRKAFILEKLSTRLNFNLRSAPGKTEKQLLERYQQLNILSSNEQVSGDEQGKFKEDDDMPEAADESNPYDFRHFLPKEKSETEKKTDEGSSLDSLESQHSGDRSAPSFLTPNMAFTQKPRAKAPPKTKTKANPLRPQLKRVTKPTAAKASNTTKPKPKPNPKSAPRIEPEEDVVETFPSVEEPKPSSPPATATSSSNIIVDGDLIIDMGSPPPERPKFKLNPRHFASSNTSANEGGDGSDDDGDDGSSRSPSPPRLAVSRAWQTQRQLDEGDDRDDEDEGAEEEDGHEAEAENNEEMVDDDDLAAEMEAAFEESAREEEEERARTLLLQQQQHQHHHHHHRVVSDDESEVSEEE